VFVRRSNILKYKVVCAGGWFAVAIAFAIFLVSQLWQFGTKRKQAALNDKKAGAPLCASDKQ